ncbi:hypothetical protein F4780DRAFT_751884 [Xylariomycetidae sp. FL0641]|nr:hypothetical protein F4780DRAFT_751884 [Xylariomycetidae sp. FL0641]
MPAPAFSPTPEAQQQEHQQQRQQQRVRPSKRTCETCRGLRRRCEGSTPECTRCTRVGRPYLWKCCRMEEKGPWRDGDHEPNHHQYEWWAQ